MRRSRTRMVSVGLALAVLAGCTADTAAAPPPAPVDAPPPAGPLPPEDTAGLAVEPMLVVLYDRTGTVLTRGAVIERRVRASAGGATTYGPGGPTIVRRPHLALYIAFADEDLDDLDRYLDAIAPLTREFAGAAFERWPGIASFDICLVAASDSDVAPEPAIALVDVTREGYERWVADGADLAGLRASTLVRDSGVRLQLSGPLGDLLAARDRDGRA